MDKIQEIETCWEFKECKDLNEYINKFLPEDENEAAYQYAYDVSNDYARNTATYNTDGIQAAFLAGVKYQKNKDYGKN